MFLKILYRSSKISGSASVLECRPFEIYSNPLMGCFYFDFSKCLC